MKRTLTGRYGDGFYSSSAKFAAGCLMRVGRGNSGPFPWGIRAFTCSRAARPCTLKVEWSVYLMRAPRNENFDELAGNSGGS